SSLKTLLANQASDAWSCDYASECYRGARRIQACGQHRRDVRTGLTRIHANQYARSLVLPFEKGSERATAGVQRGVVQGRLTGFATNTVGAEELFGHEEGGL